MTLRHLSLFHHHFIPTIKLDTPLFIERNEHLSAKNPGTDHIIWQAWVAKAGQMVGRITAQIDTLHRERYGKDTGHFGMIDAIDDPQVLPRCLAQRKRG